MRCVPILTFVVYCSALVGFLGQNLPERARTDPQSIKETIGSWVATPGKKDGPGPEGIILVAVLGIPALLAFTAWSAIGHAAKLRAQVARMDAATDVARTATDEANGAACGARVAIRELSGDTLEQRLLTISNGHGEIKRSLETIERSHAERMHRMADRARILTLQITETTERVTAMCDDESAMARTVDATEELRRALDTKLAENEGEGNLAERLAEAECGMDGYVPRIEALEALKPSVMTARRKFVDLVARLADANGTSDATLRDIVRELKTDIASFETDDLVPAETDDDGNELSGEFDNLPDLDDFEKRIEALANLTVEVLAERAKLEELKKHLDAANGNETQYLRDIFVELKTGTDELDTAITEAGQDEDENDLSDELDNIDLDDLLTRIEAIEGLAPKILEAKTALAALKQRLALLNGLDVEQEIKTLSRGCERAKGLLDGFDEDEVSEQGDQLDAIDTDLDALAQRLEALRERFART